jgi:hypothetical protein
MWGVYGAAEANVAWPPHHPPAESGTQEKSGTTKGEIWKVARRWRVEIWMKVA